MTTGKLHIPKELEYLLDEPRSELEVDISAFPISSGQVSATSSCPFYDSCLVKDHKRNCNDYKNCQTNKFYNRYGESYNELFI